MELESDPDRQNVQRESQFEATYRTSWMQNIPMRLHRIVEFIRQNAYGIARDLHLKTINHIRTRHGETGRNFGFLPVHLTALRSPWLFENAPRETVDLSYPSSERSRQQCATYPADTKERKKERESEWNRVTGGGGGGTHRCAAVIDVRYHRSIVGIFRVHLRYRKPWDLDFFERNVFYSPSRICQSPVTTQVYIARVYQV